MTDIRKLRLAEKPISLKIEGAIPRHTIAQGLRRAAYYLLPDGKRFGAVYGEKVLDLAREKGIITKTSKTLEVITFAEVNPEIKIHQLRSFASEFNQANKDVKLEFKDHRLRFKIPDSPPPQTQVSDEGINIVLSPGQDSYSVSTPKGPVRITVEIPKTRSIYETIDKSPYGLDETALLEKTGIEKEELYDLIGALARRESIKNIYQLKEGKFTLRYLTREQRQRLLREGKIYLYVDEAPIQFTFESETELRSEAIAPVIAGDDTLLYYSPASLRKLKAQDAAQADPARRHFATYVDKKGNEKVVYTSVAERWIHEGRVVPALDVKGFLQVLDFSVAFKYPQEVLNYSVNRILQHIHRYYKSLTAEEQALIKSTANLCLETYGNSIFKDDSTPILNHCLNVGVNAAGLGADPITVSAALLHKVEKRALARILISLAKKYPSLRDNLKDIPILIERLDKAFKMSYSPPRTSSRPKRRQHHIQNHIDLILNLTRHDGRHDHRVLLLLFAEKLATVQNMIRQPRSRTARENLYNEIRHIFASQAHRFFFTELYYKFLNQVFRMLDPEKFKEVEADVRNVVKDSPQKLRIWMAKMAKELVRAAAKTTYGVYTVPFRQKFEQSIYEKIMERDKDHEYGGKVSRLLDLFGFFLITEEKIYSSSDSEKLVFDALSMFILRPLPERSKVHEKTGAHRINFLDTKNRGVEVQVMSKEEYRKYTISGAPHWAFKLIELTEEAFDLDIIRSYDHRITGNFEKDFYVVTEHLNDVVIVNYLDKENEIRHRRLKRGAIPVDLAASRSINALDENYCGVEVAELSRDEDGNPLIGPWREVSEDYQFQDGDLIRIKKKGKKKLSDSNLRRQLVPKCTDVRAKLLLDLWDKKEFSAKAKEGRAQAKETGFLKGESSAGLHQFAWDCGFLNVEEFFAAFTNQQLISQLAREGLGKIIISLDEKGREKLLRVFKLGAG